MPCLPLRASCVTITLLFASAFAGCSTETTTSWWREHLKPKPEPSQDLSKEPEALLWAKSNADADGAMQFSIVADPAASAAAQDCAAHLTAGIPPCVQGLTSKKWNDLHAYFLANTSGTRAALSVLREEDGPGHGWLIVWPDLHSAEPPLVMDAAGKWLSDHHVVLIGDQTTVIDVRAPSTRFVFNDTTERAVRASNDGKWLVIDPSGSVRIGQLDFDNAEWSTATSSLPIAQGVTVIDAVFSKGGDVIITQESCKDEPLHIRGYRLTDAQWAKTFDEEGWWHGESVLNYLNVYSMGATIDAGQSVCLFNSRLPLLAVPPRYHRLRVLDDGTIETRAWHFLGLDFGEDAFWVSPSGRFAYGRSRNWLTGNPTDRIVRIGPLAAGELRSRREVKGRGATACWLRVQE